jgi:hypothetical protein
MTLSINDLGAIGGFVGGVGVAISLLYLARQIQQANQSNIAATTHAVSSFFAGLLVQIGENRYVCELLLRLGRGETLEGADQLQFVFILRGQLVAFENYYNQYALGFMDRSGWEARRGIVVEIIAIPSVRAIWDHSLSREHHPAFVQELRLALHQRDQAAV